MRNRSFLQECFLLIIICSNLVNLLVALGTLNVKKKKKKKHLLSLWHGCIFSVYQQFFTIM